MLSHYIVLLSVVIFSIPFFPLVEQICVLPGKKCVCCHCIAVSLLATELSAWDMDIFAAEQWMDICRFVVTMSRG